jgi:hypothetical protein
MGKAPISVLPRPSRAHIHAILERELPADQAWANVNAIADDPPPGRLPKGFDTSRYWPAWVEDTGDNVWRWQAGQHTSNIPMQFVTKKKFPEIEEDFWFDGDGIVRNEVSNEVLLYMPIEAFWKHQAAQHKRDFKFLDSMLNHGVPKDGNKNIKFVRGNSEDAGPLGASLSQGGIAQDVLAGASVSFGPGDVPNEGESQ